jgi:cell division protein FtsB
MKKEKAKTYSIEQFRAQLESEAMKRCEQQEETIRKLHEEIKMLKEHIQALQKNR